MWTIREPACRALRRLVNPAVALLVLVGAAAAIARADTAGLSPGPELAPVASLFERVRSDFPGHILTVELKRAATPLYRVKLLTDHGDVLLLGYDARTLHLESVAGHLAGGGQGTEGSSAGSDHGPDDDGHDGRDDDGRDDDGRDDDGHDGRDDDDDDDD